MVLRSFTFLIDGDFLNTRPGSPPAFATSPSVASPLVCSSCAGVISRFDELQLWDRARDGGAAEETRDEDSRGRNGSAGKANRNAEKQVKKVGLIIRAVEVLDGIGGSMTNLNRNSSFMLRSTRKEKIISVLAFEVANIITKGANLMQSLSEQNIVYLKEELLPSEGVQYLVSTDMDELLRIAAAEQRMESRPAPWTPSRKDACAVMLSLMNLVHSTAELYTHLHAMDRCEQDYYHKRQEHISLDAKDKNREFSRHDVFVTDFGTFVTASKLLESVSPWIVTPYIKERISMTRLLIGLFWSPGTFLFHATGVSFSRP